VAHASTIAQHLNKLEDKQVCDQHWAFAISKDKQMHCIASSYIMHVVVHALCWLAAWCMACPDGMKGAGRDYNSSRRSLCHCKCNDNMHLIAIAIFLSAKEGFPRENLQKPLFMGCWQSSSDTRSLGSHFHHRHTYMQLLQCMLHVHEHSWGAVAVKLSRLN